MAVARGTVEVEPSSRGRFSRVKTKGASEALDAGAEEAEPPGTVLGEQAVRTTARARAAAVQDKIRFIIRFLQSGGKKVRPAGDRPPSGKFIIAGEIREYHHKIYANQQQISDKSLKFLNK